MNKVVGSALDLEPFFKRGDSGKIGSEMNSKKNNGCLTVGIEKVSHIE